MKHKFENGDIVGLYYNNGIQVIVTVDKDDEHFLHVKHLLGIQLNDTPDGPKVTFEDLTPFAELDEKGLDTRIHHSNIMAVFPVHEGLLTGYKARTGQEDSKIQIVSAPSMISALTKK